MSKPILCREGGFLVSWEVAAKCPACGWEDEQPADASIEPDGTFSTGRIRPHKPLSVLIPVHEGAAGWRYDLDEQPIVCGTTLELRWWSGVQPVWIPVRFEMIGGESRWAPPEAKLFVTLPGREDREVRGVLAYSRELWLRWPEGGIPSYRDKLACPACYSGRRPCPCGESTGDGVGRC